MTHFVPVPPDREYWVPKLKTLSLYDQNGTAAINVWGLPDDAVILSGAGNGRLVADPYRKTGDLTTFYLRGLQTGDKIAVFQWGPPMVRMTEWLPVVFVAADRRAAARKAGTLPRSVHKSNFVLDPHGAEQRFPPVRESDWLSGVETAIARIRTNPVGRIVTDAIAGDVTIVPFIRSGTNANAAIAFTAQAGGTAPGAAADELLFHELCHAVEFAGRQPLYVNVEADGLDFEGFEFFAITATNVYASFFGRPLRADHRGFQPIPAAYADPVRGVAVMKVMHDKNFAAARRASAAVVQAIGAARVPWNPFR